jgi:hypothetical protein
VDSTFLQNSDTTDTITEGTSPNKFNTFILHTPNIRNTNWQHRPNNRQNIPTFIAFDHGTHIHIIFSTTNYQNISRSIHRILTWFNTTPSGVAEAFTTLQ